MGETGREGGSMGQRVTWPEPLVLLGVSVGSATWTPGVVCWAVHTKPQEAVISLLGMDAAETHACVHRHEGAGLSLAAACETAQAPGGRRASGGLWLIHGKRVGRGYHSQGHPQGQCGGDAAWCGCPWTSMPKPHTQSSAASSEFSSLSLVL